MDNIKKKKPLKLWLVDTYVDYGMTYSTDDPTHLSWYRLCCDVKGKLYIVDNAGKYFRDMETNTWTWDYEITWAD